MYLICVWMCVSMYHMCVCVRARVCKLSVSSASALTKGKNFVHFQSVIIWQKPRPKQESTQHMIAIEVLFRLNCSRS